MIRSLEHGVPRFEQSSTAHNLSKATLILLKKKGEKKENPKERHPHWSAVDSLLNRDIDEFILLWELSEDAEPED